MQVTEMSTELAAQLASAELTYDEVGATAGTLPSGYQHVFVSRQGALAAKLAS